MPRNMNPVWEASQQPFPIRKLPAALHRRIWSFVIVDNVPAQVYNHKRKGQRSVKKQLGNSKIDQFQVTPRMAMAFTCSTALPGGDANLLLLEHILRLSRARSGICHSPKPEEPCRLCCSHQAIESKRHHLHPPQPIHFPSTHNTLFPIPNLKRLNIERSWRYIYKIGNNEDY